MNKNKLVQRRKGLMKEDKDKMRSIKGESSY